jgi:hypothetical protein
MVKHYHVIEGMNGGYMPDSGSYATSRRSAEMSAAWSANNARNDGYAVTGSARKGWYDVMPEDSDPHTLGNYIEIAECFESECSEDDCV